MLRKIKICSTVLLPLLKPACSFLNLLSTPSQILSIITLPNTLLGTDVKVIPLQLPHSVRSPFFGILTISTCFHDFGTSSLSQIVLNKSSSHFSDTSMSAFNNSTVMLSLPPDLPFYIFLIAVLISAFVIWLVLISLITGSHSRSAIGTSGTGLFKISSKCSFHLSLLTVSSVSRFPDLSLTAFTDLLLSLHKVFCNLKQFFHLPSTCRFLSWLSQIIHPLSFILSHAFLYFFFLVSIFGS